ncbi:VTT domain-containing protein [Rhodanobacter sp. 7MK24]|uniref:VTT domain-containing protein n=1 Tax=Rhodanobacter sp. 7MK24 TaxID=2775922 RepID=UPI0017854285|nr:VTT domain-containing protein [Rhodanobacter sp. 7MK24]
MIALIAQYGLLLVFLNVLAAQAGVPVPAVPTLVVAGALAAGGRLSLAGIVAAALAASLIGDLAWYLAGRRYGAGVMRTLCRISLSPDSCVKQSELHFQRWRGQVLLVAKFVPGLSMLAPPLVGAMGLSPRSFMLLDGVGALLWAGVAIALGYVFAGEVDRVLDAIAGAGTVAVEAVTALLVAYVAVKWWRRKRLLRSLRMARIGVEELAGAIAAGRAPVVIDVRSALARQLDGRLIPDALLAEVDGVVQVVDAIPFDRELVVYCNCPNEVSAAYAAQALMAHGYRHVRPLLGGLDAWDAAGYTVHRLAAAVVAGAGQEVDDSAPTVA